MFFSKLSALGTALALLHLILPVQAVVRIRAGDNVLVGEQNTPWALSKVQDLFFDDQHFWVKIGDTPTSFGAAFQVSLLESPGAACCIAPINVHSSKSKRDVLMQQCHIEGKGPSDRAEEFTFTQIPGKARAHIDKCGCWGGAFMHCDVKVECGDTGKC